MASVKVDFTLVLSLFPDLLLKLKNYTRTAFHLFNKSELF